MHSPTNYKANLEIGPSLKCLADTLTNILLYSLQHHFAAFAFSFHYFYGVSFIFHFVSATVFAISCFAVRYLLLLLFAKMQTFAYIGEPKNWGCNVKIMQTLLIDFYTFKIIYNLLLLFSMFISRDLFLKHCLIRCIN